MQEIAEIVEWIQLGLHLGMRLSKLQEIHEKYHTVEECKLNMIHSWLIDTKEPTWEKLITAVAKCGHVHIATKMKSKFHIDNSREIAFDGKWY